MRLSKEVRDAWKVVEKSAAGRLVLGHILAMCGHRSDAFCATDRDTAYELGKRSIGLLISDTLDDIDRCTCGAVRAYKDAVSREREKNISKQEQEAEEA